MHALRDLETGNSLNIAPPGWQKTFGPPAPAADAVDVIYDRCPKELRRDRSETPAPASLGEMADAVS